MYVYIWTSRWGHFDVKNPPSWFQIHQKIGLGGGLGGSWERFLGYFLALGGILGPKRHQDLFQELPEKIRPRNFEGFGQGFGA